MRSAIMFHAYSQRHENVIPPLNFAFLEPQEAESFVENLIVTEPTKEFANFSEARRFITVLAAP
jgi:hypothetical protein